MNNSKKRRSRLFSLMISALVATACGGGDPPPPPPPPGPTVSLSANPATIVAGGTSTLSWTSSNATSCTASGGWSGARPTSGSEQVGPLNANATYTLTCTGSGGTSAPVNTGVVVTTPAAASLSGNLLVPAIAQSDRDTNDIILTPVSNNTFAQAQPIPTPAMVGGYLNRPGAGPPGPLQAAGDVSDFYAVSLVRDQVIELTVANSSPALNDLDLELYASNQILVNASAGVGRTERLVVPAAGNYFIRVLVFGGASNYVLTVGQTGTTALAAPTMRDDFVPGEVFVKLVDADQPAGNADAAQKAQASVSDRYGLVFAGGGADRELLLGLTAESIHIVARAKPTVGEALDELNFANAEDRRKWETLQLIKQLAKESAIAWAEPNYIFSAHAVPNDSHYPRQRWHYELINLPAAWDVTTGSTNVIAAVIDTGVRPHLELGPKFVPGFDFVRGLNAGDGNGLDPDASDPGHAAQGTFYFHGTHVAGTIAAASNEGAGVAGVSWGARIMPVRVLGIDGRGDGNDIIEGIRYAAGLSNASGTVPARRADVINLSLGGPFVCPQAYQSVFDAARAAGVVVVASAGNDGTSGNYSPAGCAGVISVSSVDATRARAPYSNFGLGVDVAAPGGHMGVDRNGDGQPDGIFSTHSTFNGVSYGSSADYMEGTSMAAPHVAGVIALMRSVNPALTPANIDALLGSGAITDDIGSPGPDSLGVGLINALKAVQASGGPPGARPPRLGVVASSLNFGDSISGDEVTVSNAGDGTLAVASTAASASWLSVSAAQVNASGLGRYRIQVNRSGLAVGTYNGLVEFRGSVGPPARVTVLMQVTSAPVVSDAGQHYLLLVDPDTFDTLVQVERFARGPSTAYTFADLSRRRYVLVAGTDFDNDGFICDDGEACGEYPVFGAAQVIDLLNTMSGIEFTTGFRAEAQATLAAEGTPVSGPRYRRIR